MSVTRARPRRPQVRPFGGLKSWPDSSSKTSQAIGSAAVLYRRPSLLPPCGDRRLVRSADRRAGIRSGAAAQSSPDSERTQAPSAPSEPGVRLHQEFTE